MFGSCLRNFGVCECCAENSKLIRLSGLCAMCLGRKSKCSRIDDWNWRPHSLKNGNSISSELRKCNRSGPSEEHFVRLHLFERSLHVHTATWICGASIMHMGHHRRWMEWCCTRSTTHAHRPTYLHENYSANGAKTVEYILVRLLGGRLWPYVKPKLMSNVKAWPVRILCTLCCKYAQSSSSIRDFLPFNVNTRGFSGAGFIDFVAFSCVLCCEDDKSAQTQFICIHIS